MSKVVIEFEPRDWKDFNGQNIDGEIIKHDNKFKVRVEIPQLPGNYVDYDIQSPIQLNDELIGKTVIGDTGNGEFHIRIICLLTPLSIE